MGGCILDVDGIRVGTATDKEALTGCTVVLPDREAVAGVDVRGSAPGTRETDLLKPTKLVDKLHGVLLSGGSAFGLDAAAGVMGYLEEQGKGFTVENATVPIVPAAVIFDLGVGNSSVRPGKEMGYNACVVATRDAVEEGNVGAGTGATVGKVMGLDCATKSGQGTACISAGNLTVGALAVVNAMGDIFDNNGKQIAGPRSPEDGSFMNTGEIITSGGDKKKNIEPGNTTLGVVATNARLNKEGVNKVAQMAQDGLARSIWPVHTMWDGDTVFVLSLGEEEADWSLTGMLAAEALAEAVQRAVLMAVPAGGIPAAG